MNDDREFEQAPFYIKCNRCGSLNVDVTAYDLANLEFKCKACGQVLNIGHYNACLYESSRIRRKESKKCYIVIRNH